MHDQSEAQQAMLERMLMLEYALDRAEAGTASKEDWDIIRSECGIPRRQSKPTQSNRSESWVL